MEICLLLTEEYAMKRKMRRSDRLMKFEDALYLLTKAKYGVLSSVDEEGQPYGVPVNFVFDGEKSIYFHSASEGHKLENLNHNPKVSFTIVGDVQVMDWKFTTAYESVILFGVASVVEGPEKQHALHRMALKFSINYMDEFENEIERFLKSTTVVKISIEHMSGKVRPFEEK